MCVCVCVHVCVHVCVCVYVCLAVFFLSLVVGHIYIFMQAVNFPFLPFHKMTVGNAEV